MKKLQNKSFLIFFGFSGGLMTLAFMTFFIAPCAFAVDPPTPFNGIYYQGQACSTYQGWSGKIDCHLVGYNSGKGSAACCNNEHGRGGQHSEFTLDSYFSGCKLMAVCGLSGWSPVKEPAQVDAGDTCQDPIINCIDPSGCNCKGVDCGSPSMECKANMDASGNCRKECIPSSGPQNSR